MPWQQFLNRQMTNSAVSDILIADLEEMYNIY